MEHVIDSLALVAAVLATYLASGRSLFARLSEVEKEQSHIRGVLEGKGILAPR